MNEEELNNELENIGNLQSNIEKVEAIKALVPETKLYQSFLEFQRLICTNFVDTLVNPENAQYFNNIATQLQNTGVNFNESVPETLQKLQQDPYDENMFLSVFRTNDIFIPTKPEIENSILAELSNVVFRCKVNILESIEGVKTKLETPGLTESDALINLNFLSTFCTQLYIFNCYIHLIQQTDRYLSSFTIGTLLSNKGGSHKGGSHKGGSPAAILQALIIASTILSGFSWFWTPPKVEPGSVTQTDFVETTLPVSEAAIQAMNDDLGQVNNFVNTVCNNVNAFSEKETSCFALQLKVLFTTKDNKNYIALQYPQNFAEAAQIASASSTAYYETSNSMAKYDYFSEIGQELTTFFKSFVKGSSTLNPINPANSPVMNFFFLDKQKPIRKKLALLEEQKRASDVDNAVKKRNEQIQKAAKTTTDLTQQSKLEESSNPILTISIDAVNKNAVVIQVGSNTRIFVVGDGVDYFTNPNNKNKIEYIESAISTLVSLAKFYKSIKFSDTDIENQIWKLVNVYFDDKLSNTGTFAKWYTANWIFLNSYLTWSVWLFVNFVFSLYLILQFLKDKFPSLDTIHKILEINKILVGIVAAVFTGALQINAVQQAVSSGVPYLLGVLSALAKTSGISEFLSKVPYKDYLSVAEYNVLLILLPFFLRTSALWLFLGQKMYNWYYRAPSGVTNITSTNKQNLQKFFRDNFPGRNFNYPNKEVCIANLGGNLDADGQPLIYGTDMITIAKGVNIMGGRPSKIEIANTVCRTLFPPTVRGGKKSRKYRKNNKKRVTRRRRRI